MKRWIALALCAVLALSLTACTFSTPATVMTVNGQEIPAGVYLSYQRQAYIDAQSMREDDKTPVLKCSIEGMKAADWIHAEAVADIKQYVWVEQAFEEAGLSFTEEELANSEAWINMIWSYTGDLIEENGVSYETYRKVYLNDEKYRELLEAYREGPDGQISDADAKAYMNEKYSRIQRLVLPATDADSAPLAPDKQAELDALAADLVERLDAGASLDDLAEETLKRAYEICGREYPEDAMDSDFGSFFITEETTVLEEELVAAIIAAGLGDAGVYQNDTDNEDVSQPVVYQKIANYEDNTDFTDNYLSAVISEMTSAAFQDKMNAEIDAYDVQENGYAVWAYRPSKIKETL